MENILLFPVGLAKIVEVFGINLHSLASDNVVAKTKFQEGIKFNFSLAEYEQAIKAYNQALEADHNFWEACLLKGILLCQLGQFNQALKPLSKVVKIRPNSSAVLSALNALAIALQELKRDREAVWIYQQALQIEPLDRDILTNYQQLIQKTKQSQNLHSSKTWTLLAQEIA